LLWDDWVPVDVSPLPPPHAASDPPSTLMIRLLMIVLFM
jgi:hypothetical protein